MNKVERKVVETKLKITSQLLVNLHIHKRNIIKISDTNAKYSKIAEKSSFLNLVYTSSIRLFVFDFMKLSYNSCNEDYNFFKTINYFESIKNHQFWKHKIPKDRLNELIEKLYIPAVTFNQIKNLRDKHFAHTDKDTQKPDYKTPKVILRDLWQHLDLMVGVFTELRWYFNSMHKGNFVVYRHNAEPKESHEFMHLADDPIDELYVLYKYNSIRTLLLTEHRKLPTDESLQKYLKIIRAN